VRRQGVRGEADDRELVWRGYPWPLALGSMSAAPSLHHPEFYSARGVTLPWAFAHLSAPQIPEWQAAREEEQVSSLASLQRIPRGGKRWLAGMASITKQTSTCWLAIDAVQLSVEMHPNVVVLVRGDADFAHLALAATAAWDSCGSGRDRSNAGHWIEGRSKRGDRSSSSV
jgi:hypothetical protein